MSENGARPRLKEVYENEIRPNLTKQFGYKNRAPNAAVDRGPHGAG